MTLPKQDHEKMDGGIYHTERYNTFWSLKSFWSSDYMKVRNNVDVNHDVGGWVNTQIQSH